MCAVYEPSITPLMASRLREGCTCPRRILKAAETEVLTIKNPEILSNVNTPEEFEAVRTEAGRLLPGD